MTEPGATAAQARAGYHIPVNHFADHREPPGGHLFEAQRREMLQPGGSTRTVPLDRSAALGLPFPASTPTMLASYLCLRAGEALAMREPAVACLAYVLSGSGRSRAGDEAIEWRAGDFMVLPAAAGVVHEGSTDARLFTVTDEPLWRRLGVSALRAEPIGAVHYPARAIEREMQRLDQVAARGEAVGRAVIFTREGLHEAHLTTPFFIANINTLEPGADQRTHRHNGAALTLSLQGEGCHSWVGEERLDWAPQGVMSTPAGCPHSHHNRGARMMVSLVVQDSGFYQHAGVPGFAFDPEADLRHLQPADIARTNVGIEPAALAPQPPDA